MGFLLDKCSFSPLDEEVIAGCRPFSCGNADLDEFFQHDAPLYSKQMLGINVDFAHRGIGSELMEFIKSWFIDAGNIWTLRNYDDQPGGQFKIDEFWKQIAVSYGFDVTSVINMLAYSYAFVGDMISALQTIDRAIEIEPQDINLYDSKGEILLMQGDRDGAMKMWEKIMELDPSFAEKHPDSVLYTKLFKETAE